jgi:antitoxin PrlF
MTDRNEVPMSVIVKEGGELILPKAALKRLGVVPGMAVDIVNGAEGEIVVKKAAEDEISSRLEKWRGTATAGLTTDEIMAMTRGEE